MDGFRYRAFLSYSHADRRVAERLHRALEGYRLPRRLVGRAGPSGPVPARVQPVFRDRDELTASGHIGAVVEEALSASRTMIVLCSTAAAKSSWVDAEIAAFRRLRPDGVVLCVLVDGEPMASRDPATSARECLPPSLRKRFGAGAGMQDSAPVAVDLRPQGDGWRLGLQKLVAGLAGVPLDQLVQRDAHRRHQRLAWLAAALAAIAVTLGTMAVVAFHARDEARAQRAQAEGLIEFMLGDLRERLEPVGRLDALDAVGQRALRYYDSQDPRGLEADALGRRSRALHMIGDLRDRRGDRAGALRAFRRASETTAELLQRDPGNAQRIYDHAQSVFWVAYAGDWQSGRSTAAERAFREYQQLAKRLVRKDPSNLAWQAEVAYSHANLGVMLMDQGRASEAAPEFERSRLVNERRVAAQKGDPQALLDLGQDYSWLASAAQQHLQFARSLELRRREIALYAPILQRDPRDAPLQGRMMFARRFLAETLLDTGQVDAAERELALATAAARVQRHLEPDNTDWPLAEAKSLLLQARVLEARGQPDAGLALVKQVRPMLAALMKRDPNAWAWQVELQEAMAHAESDLLRAAGRTAAALRVATASEDRLRAVMRNPDRQDKGARWFALSEGRLARLLDQNGDHAQASAHWRTLASALTARTPRLGAEETLWLARADEATGRASQAAALTDALRAAGYRNPDFGGSESIRGVAEAGEGT